jgi:hypothetical protein
MRGNIQQQKIVSLVHIREMWKVLEDETSTAKTRRIFYSSTRLSEFVSLTYIVDGDGTLVEF